MIIVNERGERTDISLKGGISNAVMQIFKSQAPTRTGVLKGQIRVNEIEGGFQIVSDIHYMPYTTEKWVSPRWRGRANPNEAWWDQAWDLSLRFLSSIYGKEFKREQ
jgi:hypothetical protein